MLRRFLPLVFIFAACSSSSSSARLDVTNDAKQQATFVYGKSTDDSVPWNTFVKGANEKVIEAGQSVHLNVPPAGHYRWGALEFVPDPKNPDTVLHQVVYESSFDSDGTAAITVHIPASTDTSPGTDGGTGEGGVGKLCSKASDCTSGFCVTGFCACDSAGHSKCPCTAKGSSCSDDGECCSLSCGFNTDGVCD